MTPKFLIAFGLMALVFVSCNKSEIEDLEDRIDRLEDAVGTDEPIKVEFSTVDNAEADFSFEKTFAIKSIPANSHYYVEVDQGIYYVFVGRASSVDGLYYEGGEYSYFSFYYDSETKEVFDLYTYIRHRDPFYYWMTFYMSDGDSETELTADIKSFNIETGALDIVVNGSTSDQSEYNYFDGNAMNLKMSFKGKLQEVYGD